jgi:hypothetical protein
MIKNSFLQKVFLTMFWGLCAAGLIEFYKNFVWRANEDLNGEAAMKELYGDARQTARPARHGSNAR